MHPQIKKISAQVILFYGLSYSQAKTITQPIDLPATAKQNWIVLPTECCQPTVQSFPPLPAIASWMIQADHVDSLNNGAKNIFYDHVLLRHDTEQAQGQQLIVTTNTRKKKLRTWQMNGQGRILTHDGIFWFDHARGTFHDGPASWQAMHIDYQFWQQQGHGSASQAETTGKQSWLLHHATYTTCPPGNEHWHLAASSIYLDQIHHQGKAKHTVFYLAKLPIFYSPWLTFPLDNHRQTGLLTPTFGTSSNLGHFFEEPLYLNIKPNLDATLYPIASSTAGAGLGQEWRYLNPYGQINGYGFIAGNRRNQDPTAADNLNYAVHLQSGWSLGNDWQWNTDYTKSTDSLFTYLWQDSLEAPFPNNQQLLQTTRLSQATNSYTIAALWQSYQSLQWPNAPTDEQYRISPGIDWQWWPNTLSFIQTKTSFRRFRLNSNSIEGDRLAQYIDMAPVGTIGHWWWQPEVRINHISDNWHPANISSREQQQFWLPSYRIQTGTSWISSSSSSWVHTIQPNITWIKTPYHDQSSLPIFDTIRIWPSFEQLQQLNRYLGDDRIGDSHHAVVSMHQDWSEQERHFAWYTGADYYLQDEQLQINPTDTRAKAKDYYWLNQFGFDHPRWGHIQWFTSWDQPQQHWAELTGLWSVPVSPKLTTTLAYYHAWRGELADPTQGDINQVDTELMVHLNQNWQIATRLLYQIKQHQLDRIETNFRYQGCCTAISAGVFRRLDTTNTIKSKKYDRGVLVSIDLLGLGEIGQSNTLTSRLKSLF